jgi:hypothetical protein
VVGKEWNPQILVNLTVSKVQSIVSRSAKTLGLQNVLLLDVSAGSGLQIGHA